MSLLSRFFRDRRGNVAVIFGLSLVPLIGAAGIAVDYSHLTETRNRLADALDAGVLSVAREPEMSNAAAEKKVKEWVNAHLGSKLDWTLTSFSQNDGTVTATASASVDMTLARVLGFDKREVKVLSEAVRSMGLAEIVLVLDNTGSMQTGNKIGKLKQAATAFVEMMEEATDKPQNLKIGLVPFSQTVNVGKNYKNAPWIDAGGSSASAKSLFKGQKVNRFALFQKMEKSWGGCVETRAMPYEIDGTVPDATKPDTLYVPYFAPDEPGTKGAGPYNNSYLDDPSDIALATLTTLLNALGLSNVQDWLKKQVEVATKYKKGIKTGTTGSMNYQYGPNSGCEIAPLLRLSSDTGKVKTAINAMIANGNTDIPIGLEWGWNVLAPNGPFGDGEPYDDPDWRKYVVLMTDGNNQNVVPDSANKNQSLYSGIGYIWQGRTGISSGAEYQRTKARDARLTELCENMKEEGIIIYTVRVEVNEGSSKVLRDCASDPAKFYDVQSAANLTDVFKDIGGSIQELRLAR